MAFLPIFVIGLTVGYVARRYAFCIFGALFELLALGSPKRIVAVVSAMLVFGFVQFGEYEHGTEYAGPKYLAGGLLQGVGYYLAIGCPLGMLVRVGEGSKFHLMVFVGFLVGVAVYAGLLDGPASSVLDPLEFRGVVTLPELFQ